MTQETLKEVAKHPEAATFVEPFIEIPPTPRKETKREIPIRPVPRVERIEEPNFFASLASPGGLVIFLILYLGNVYAAYEIARYKRRPPGLVCGLSLVFPVLAPAIFLAMPPAAEADLVDTGAAEPAGAAQAAGKSTTGPLAKTPMASGLSIAQGEKGGAATAAAAPQVYKRGEFTFNRRFMETKFPGWFRVVQGEAEKDNILVVRSAKEEFVGRRISRISSNEMHLQLLRGNEVSIPFADITEVQIRPKDAKG